MNPSSVQKRNIIGSGRFLTLAELEYTDPSGKVRKWETVDRRGTGSLGAVWILARIMPQDEIVLIRQFRPPAGRLMLEFPAGLVDPEETVETTARRELLEETGYEGRLVRCNLPGYSSPGMTGETIAMAEMLIDGEIYCGRAPAAQPDEGEFIEVFTVKRKDLPQFIAAQEKQDVGIDSKIYAYAAALDS